MDAKRRFIAAAAAVAPRRGRRRRLVGDRGARHRRRRERRPRQRLLRHRPPRERTLALNDSQRVHYTIQRDAAGAYLLPAYYVGAVEGQGFEIDGTRPAEAAARPDAPPAAAGALCGADFVCLYAEGGGGARKPGQTSLFSGFLMLE
jgi:hypothetical protein